MVLQAGSPPLSNGQFARDLLQRQIDRLVQLQTSVAEGKGPEPLHQMRVTMRRLRTTVVQF